jgi:hypothetical protein
VVGSFDAERDGPHPADSRVGDESANESSSHAPPPPSREDRDAQLRDVISDVAITGVIGS